MGKVETKKVEDVLLQIPFGKFAVVTVSLPALSLLYCFLTGIIFRFDEVNETVCQASNVVPSISAVTGITPGAYVWRICIALHSTPRFAVGFIYYNYFKARLSYINPKYRWLYIKLLSLNFWMYTIENACLLSVAMVSNRENYPIHEKIFVVFMIMSCCYMLSNTLIYKWSRTPIMSDIEKKSLRIKWISWTILMAATAGLLYTFVLHRIYCVPFAFSFFSAFEYVIAYANMAYHVSAYYEFMNKSIMSGDIHQDTDVNGDLKSTEKIPALGAPDDRGDRSPGRSLRPRKKMTGEKVQ
ncbi:hypothetical protein FSP39_010148 [Pinctada imbricata]|uniref:CWH43-like N-terminal domain-containing protein n=1 Tax=Pinctada imbricata TaxID=66713 RepID=A0AA89BX74_PINIB|nr:hypothetical protein FSP39_010148 [Pinctada imbricata]